MRRAGAIIMGALTLVAAGCGGADELSASAFRERANAICRDLQEANEQALKGIDPKDRDELVDASEEIGKRTDAALDELGDLSGPDAAEQGVERFLEAAEEFRQTVGDRAKAASGDREALTRADEKVAAMSKKVQQTARDVGLDACAS